MEVILGFIILIAASVAIRLIFRGASAGAKATFNAATGRDSFKDSFKTEFLGMGDFEIRVVRTVKQTEGLDFDVFEIQARGIIPVPTSQTECSIYIQLLDITNGENYPIISVLDQCCENNSRAYQNIVSLGAIPLDSGYRNWVAITIVIIDCLSLPYSGERELLFQACVVPSNAPPLFYLGLRSGQSGQIFAIGKTTAKYNTDNIGYMEALQYRQEVQELIIEISFYIASSDKHLALEEATIIREWITQVVESYSDDKREYHKERLNNSIRQSYNKANQGNINIESLVTRMNQIASLAEKYEAIELCLDVMKADDRVDSAELEQINNIAKMLDIDPQRFRALQDRRLAEVKHIDITTESTAQILGITADMNKEDIRKHLASEYRKWNSRVNSNDDNVREKAKEMLLVIGQARNEYLAELVDQNNEYK